MMKKDEFLERLAMSAETSNGKIQIQFERG